MKRLILTLCILVLTCSGCKEQTSIEDYGFLETVGIDYVSPKKMNVTATVLESTSGKGKLKMMVYRVKNVHTYPEARDEMSNRSREVITPLQLRVILFDEEYARKVGLAKIIFQMYRNPEVADHVLIGITKEKTSKILGMLEQTDVSYAFSLLTPPNETVFASPTRIYNFIYRLTSGTGDLVIPYLKKHGKELQLSGLALFKGDRLTGYMSEEASPFYRLLQREKPEQMIYILKIRKHDKKEVVAVKVLNNDSDVEVLEPNSDHPTFNIKATVNCSINSLYGQRKLDTDEKVDALAQDMARQSEEILHKELMRLSQLGIDPFELTEYLRASYKGKWKKEYGLKQLKKAKFKIHFVYHINSFGNTFDGNVDFSNEKNTN